MDESMFKVDPGKFVQFDMISPKVATNKIVGLLNINLLIKIYYM